MFLLKDLYVAEVPRYKIAVVMVELELSDSTKVIELSYIAFIFLLTIIRRIATRSRVSLHFKLGPNSDRIFLIAKS